ncbi:MAG: Veg family protein [Gudongella sp.]|nr:Veg family protein [Gudongella sp.]
MTSVAQIKKDLEECIGMKVILKANRGRKKTTVREGVLESAYPSLFIVRISNDYDSSRTVSYTYSDVLTSTVEVTILDESERLVSIS